MIALFVGVELAMKILSRASRIQIASQLIFGTPIVFAGLGYIAPDPSHSYVRTAIWVVAVIIILACHAFFVFRLLNSRNIEET